MTLSDTAREQLGHRASARPPQHDEIDTTRLRDVDDLRRSGTNHSDCFNLLNFHLPRPTLCCFDVPSSTFGRELAP
jgi:hypothetical protein